MVFVVLTVPVVRGVQHVDCVTFSTLSFFLVKYVIRERERKRETEGEKEKERGRERERGRGRGTEREKRKRKRKKRLLV